MKTRKKLRNLVLEGGVIVGSILLAFAIDAAWNEELERREEARMLEQLDIELDLYANLIDEADAANRQAVDAAKMLLQAVSVESETNPARLEAALDDLRAGYRLAAATAAFDLLAGSGSIGLVSSPVLRQGMSDFTAFVSLVREFEGAEERFIEHRLTPFLIEHTDMHWALPTPSIEGNEPSIFSTQWNDLRANREFSNLLIERIRLAQTVTRFRQELRSAVIMAQAGVLETRD
jgi:hypothetical protein